MQLLKLILPRGKGSVFMKILDENGAFAITCAYGEGSATGEIGNFLHVDKVRKEIVMGIFQDEEIDKILGALDDKISKTNTAIAFSTPLNAKGEESMELNIDYVALYVIVDRHEGQKAIHIAQKNGAKGATVIHGRGSAETVKSLLVNMNIEPEKDIVLMLVQKELVETIRSAIYEEMKLAEENRGIIFQTPVTAVSGLLEQN